VCREAEPIVATGAILAGIPCVDRVDISSIADGEPLVVDAESGRLEHG